MLRIIIKLFICFELRFITQDFNNESIPNLIRQSCRQYNAACLTRKERHAMTNKFTLISILIDLIIYSFYNSSPTTSIYIAVKVRVGQLVLCAIVIASLVTS